MPPRNQSGRTATLVSLMAAGVSAPTLSFAEDGLGLTPEIVEWAPAPLGLVSEVDAPASMEAGHVAPLLRMLPDPDDA
jgi:hypothetical protein